MTKRTVMVNAGRMTMMPLWITAAVVICFCATVEGVVRNVESWSGVGRHGSSSHQTDNDSEVLPNVPNRLLRSFGAVMEETSEGDVKKNVERKLHESYSKELSAHLQMQQESSSSLRRALAKTEIILHDDLQDSSSSSSSSPRFYPFDLSPFQLYFFSPTPHMEDMTLLKVTMDHLKSFLQSIYSPQVLDHVEMYRLVRGDFATPTDTTEGCMVAFGGQAFFRHLPTYGVDLEELGEATWLAFLGKNAEQYLEKLQELGFSDVKNVELYTLDGKHVYLKEGELRIESPGDSEEENSKPMMDETGMTMLGVAVGVPVAVFALICVCYGCLHCRGYSLCRKRGIDPMSDVWQSKNYINGSPKKKNKKDHESTPNEGADVCSTVEEEHDIHN